MQRKITMAIIQKFEMDDNKYDKLNFQNAAKAVLQRTFIALNVFIRELVYLKTNYISFQFKKQKKNIKLNPRKTIERK